MSANPPHTDATPVTRRTALTTALAASVASLATPTESRLSPDPRRASPKRYDMTAVGLGVNNARFDGPACIEPLGKPA
jgi:hypothetical protein